MRLNKPLLSLLLVLPVLVVLSHCALLDCPPGQELGATSCVCSGTLEAPVDGMCVEDVCGPDGCPCSQEGIEAAIARGGTQTILCENSDPISTISTITIDNAVTLVGQGQPLVQGDSDNVIFRVEAVEAELIGFTISNGRQGIRVSAGATVTLRDCTVRDNTSTASGGGGIFNEGTLTLVNTDVLNNTVNPGPGGGIYNRKGTLTLTSSKVNGNVSEDNGGGVQNEEGTLTIRDTEVANNNTSLSNGGGISNSDGTVTISGNSEIRNNTSRLFGGGIFTDGDSATMTITDTTISNNESTHHHGGGIRAQQGKLTATKTIWSGNESNGDGGAILVEGDETVFTLVDSTVTGNTAEGVGGGIRVYENALATIINTTIYDNTARRRGGISGGGALHIQFGGMAEVSSSTISNNDDVDSAAIVIVDDSSSLSFRQTIIDGTCVAFRPITSLDHNIESPGDTCQLVGTNDSANVAPIELNLDTQLTENPGGTPTLMLIRPSDAIDYQPLSTCDQARDQRGVSRPQGSGCDIGAVEVEEE